MADKTLKVTLKADDQLSGTFKKVGDASQQMGDAIEQSTKAASASTKSLSSDIKSLESELNTVGTSLSLMGAAGIAGLGIATNASMEFTAGLANVNSIARLSKEELDGVSDAILRMATSYGAGPQELAEGLYDIVSSGFSAAEGLGILESAAIAAGAGLTDTATSAKAITAVLNAYSLEASEAGNVSDVLFGIVDSGVITFEQLANNLGNTIPLASALGVSIEELGAAYANLTTSGVGASAAETQIAALMRSAINPTEELSNAVKEYNFASAEAMIASEGLAGFLAFLSEASGGTSEGLLNLVGTAEAANAALILGKNEGAEFTLMLGEMEASAQSGASTLAVFGIQMDNAAGSVQFASAEIQAAMIGIGAGLEPLVKAGAEITGGVVGAFNALPGPVKNSVTTFGAFASAAALATGSLMLIIPKVVEFRAAIQTLQTSGSILGTLATRLSPLTLGLGAVAAAGVLVYQSFKSQSEAAGEAREVIETLKDAYLDLKVAADQALLSGNPEQAAWINQMRFQIESMRAESQAIIDYSDNQMNSGKLKVYEFKDIEEAYKLTRQESDSLAQSQQILGAAFQDNRIDGQALAADMDALYLTFMRQEITAEEFVFRLDEMTKNTSRYAKSTEEATASTTRFAAVLNLLTGEADGWMSKLMAINDIQDDDSFLEELMKTMDVNAGDRAGILTFLDELAGGFTDLSDIPGPGATQQEWLEWVNAEGVSQTERTRRIGLANAAREEETASIHRNTLELAANENAIAGVAAAIDSVEAANLEEKLALGETLTEAMVDYNEHIAEVVENLTRLYEAAGYGDPLSQWNLSGNATDMSLLAMNTNAASTALDTVFRVVVGNTDSLASQTESIKSWADVLIGDPGTEGELDAAFSRWLEQGMELEEAQRRYNEAQNAQISITESNLRVQEAVTDIQLQQAPLIAEQTGLLADQLELISQLPAEQQLIALGWMDSATSMRAMEFQTLAVAAATGKLGENGDQVFANMIAGAAATDPVLAALLEDMGLISVGADGTITVHLSGVEGALSEMDALTVAMVNFMDLMDNNKLDGSVNFEILGLDDPREKLKDIEDIVVDLDGKQVTIPIDLKTPTGDPANPFPAGFLDLIGNLPSATIDADTNEAIRRIQALKDTPVEPLTMAVELDYGSLGAGVGASAGSAAASIFGGNDAVTIPATLDVDTSVLDTFFDSESAPTITITADDSSAAGLLDTYAGLDGSTLATTYVWAIGDDASAAGMLGTYQARNNETLANMYVWAIGDAASAQGMIDTYSAFEGSTLATAFVWAIGDGSSAQGMIDTYSAYNGLTLATTYVDVITRTSTQAFANGGVVQEYASGGVVIRAGEIGPEILNYANGGTALLPHDGLYSVPAGSYISPNNAVGNSYGGITIGDITVIGGSRDEIENLLYNDFLPRLRDDLEESRRAAGVR